MSIAIKDISDARHEADTGLIKYGDHTFSPLARISVNMIPESDDAERTVVAQRWLVTVVDYVYYNNELSASGWTEDHADKLTDATTELSKQGQRLELYGTPYGSLVINPESADTTTEDPEGGPPITTLAGRHADLSWGPKVTGLQMNTFGKITTEITWTCEFRTIPLYTSFATSFNPAAGTLGALMAFNYAVTFSIDSEGLTTRTVRGYLQIPQHRVAGSTEPNRTADQFRHNILVPPIEGWTRTQEYNESSDKCRLDFAIVDTEPNHEAYPANLLELTCNDRVNSTGGGFQTWSGSLSFSARVRMGRPTSVALSAFMTILTTKIGNLYQQLGRESPIIPQAISFDVDPFSKRVNISFNYLVVTCLENAANGILWDVPQNGSALAFTPKAWSDSMADIQSVSGRSMAKLATSPEHDLIVDLGGGVNPKSISMTSSRKRVPSVVSLDRAFSCDNINERNSYIYKDMSLQVVSRNRTVTHSFAQDTGPNDKQKTNTWIGAVWDSIIAGAAGGSTLRSDVVQQVGTPEEVVIFTGKMVRLKYPPNLPRIKKIDGLPVVEDIGARQVLRRKLGCYLGCAAESIEWIIVLRNQSGFFRGVPAPPASHFCCPDTTSTAATGAEPTIEMDYGEETPVKPKPPAIEDAGGWMWNEGLLWDE